MAIPVNRRRLLAAATMLGTMPVLPAFGSPDAQSGGVRLDVRPGPASGLFPLRSEAGKRYLVDAAGRPFLIQGDAAWSLIARLSREQAIDYLDDRRRKGFNAVLVNLIEHEFADAPPKNRYGEAPFLVSGDFGTPNERYFSHADLVIGMAAERGILVMLAPAYMGFGGGSEGWYREMAANGAARMRAYGSYVARRFRHHANILWVLGGDFNPPELVLLRALVAGIREVDGMSLNTFHGARNTGASDFLGTAESWLQVDNIYTEANNVVSKALQAHGHSRKPFFLIEGRYEGIEGFDAHTVRLQAYQTLLSGGCGQVMGNWVVWQFSGGWERALGSEGAYTIGYLRSLLEAHAWTRLVPDAANSFLTGGIRGSEDRAVAALANDGSFGLVYLPSIRKVSLNLARLAGPQVRAHWFDPSNGRLLDAPDSPFPGAGTHAFQPERNNAAGQGDWVLLLESGR